jgi:hypothetical protein
LSVFLTTTNFGVNEKGAKTSKSGGNRDSGSEVAKMKVKTVLIAWHGREPVYSIDFHSSGRIATGGADNCVNVRSRETIISCNHADE